MDDLKVDCAPAGEIAPLTWFVHCAALALDVDAIGCERGMIKVVSADCLSQ